MHIPNGWKLSKCHLQHPPTQFLRRNRIKHTRTAPYHPAERFVLTLKKAILVGMDDPRSSQHKLASFLLSYRTTPHSVTGVPPSVLLYGTFIWSSSKDCLET